MSATINDRHRIEGTRSSVYDVLTYAEGGWDVAKIAATLNLNSEQVQVALDYIAANHDMVMENYRKILARIAKGNPPEIEARSRQARQRLTEKLAEIQRRKGSDAQHLIRPQH